MNVGMFNEQFEDTRRARKGVRAASFLVAAGYLACAAVLAGLTGLAPLWAVITLGALAAVSLGVALVPSRNEQQLRQELKDTCGVPVEEAASDWPLKEEQKKHGTASDRCFDEMQAMQERAKRRQRFFAFLFVPALLAGTLAGTLAGYDYYKRQQSHGPVNLTALPGHFAMHDGSLKANTAEQQATVFVRVIEQAGAVNQAIYGGSDKIRDLMQDIDQSVTAHSTRKPAQREAHAAAAQQQIESIRGELTQLQHQGLPQPQHDAVQATLDNLKVLETRVGELKNGTVNTEALDVASNNVKKAWNSLVDALGAFLRALVDWLMKNLDQLPDWLKQLGLALLNEALGDGSQGAGQPSPGTGRPGKPSPGQPGGGQPVSLDDFLKNLVREFSQNPPIRPSRDPYIADPTRTPPKTQPWTEPISPGRTGGGGSTKGPTGKVQTGERPDNDQKAPGQLPPTR